MLSCIFSQKIQKMRKLLFLYFLLFSVQLSQAQLSILFVDDSNDQFGNAELFKSALDSLGYEATYFDAEGMGVSPSAEVMASFDLIIWHTSTNGVGLQFWNGNDEDNQEIKTYLDNGGRLWLVGLDFMFDRYGTPPDQFTEGDFPYDYLGIQSYIAQSYGNDGNLGVPMAVPFPGGPIPGLDTLRWQFSTLWWADAVDPRPEATVIYEFGEAPYVMDGSPTGIYYSDGNFTVISYFFDLAVVRDFEMLKSTTQPVLAFFEQLSTSVSEDIHDKVENIYVYPNPSSGPVTVDFQTKKAGVLSIQIIDLNGKIISEPVSNLKIEAGDQKINFESGILPGSNGLYYIQIKINEGRQVVPWMLTK